MGSYKLVVKRSVAKDLRRVDPKDVRRIVQRIESLVANPRPPQSEKLSGQERYRVRQGAYRILYEIHDDELVVIVVKIGHRREVYRGT